MTATFTLRDLVLYRGGDRPETACPQDAFDRIVARILDREGAEFTAADVAGAGGNDGPEAAGVALAFLADRQIITPVPDGPGGGVYRAGPDLQADAIAAFWALDGDDPAPESDSAPGSVAPAPTPATASGMATLIRQVLDLTIEAATDPDDGMFELAEPLAGYEALTYEDAGIPTHDAGLVLRASDGREFQVTVVRSR